MKILFALFLEDTGQKFYHKGRELHVLKKEIDWVVPDKESLVYAGNIECWVYQVYHHLRSKLVVEIKPYDHNSAEELKDGIIRLIEVEGWQVV